MDRRRKNTEARSNIFDEKDVEQVQRDEKVRL